MAAFAAWAATNSAIEGLTLATQVLPLAAASAMLLALSAQGASAVRSRVVRASRGPPQERPLVDLRSRVLMFWARGKCRALDHCLQRAISPRAQISRLQTRRPGATGCLASGASEAVLIQHFDDKPVAIALIEGAAHGANPPSSRSWKRMHNSSRDGERPAKRCVAKIDAVGRSQRRGRMVIWNNTWRRQNGLPTPRQILRWHYVCDGVRRRTSPTDDDT